MALWWDLLICGHLKHDHTLEEKYETCKYIASIYVETTLYQSNSFAKTQCFWSSPREVCYFSYEPLQVVHSKDGMRIM